MKNPTAKVMILFCCLIASKQVIAQESGKACLNLSGKYVVQASCLKSNHFNDTDVFIPHSAGGASALTTGMDFEIIQANCQGLSFVFKHPYDRNIEVRTDFSLEDSNVGHPWEMRNFLKFFRKSTHLRFRKFSPNELLFVNHTWALSLDTESNLMLSYKDRSWGPLTGNPVSQLCRIQKI